MENKLSGIDNFVRFTNSQGVDGRGTVIYITRSSVVFEVYNPYSIVQLSEVLQSLKVMRGERTIYDGKAVISNLVSTGLMVIVSATLVDPWVDMADLSTGEALIEETERFVEDWESGNSLQPGYQLIVSRISNFLSELNHWLVEAEARISSDSKDKLQGEAFFSNVAKPLSPKLYKLFTEFEERAALIDSEEIMVHKSFAKRMLHPYILCSPFAHRSYTKPLGYAGDYEMVNMMLRESDAEAKNSYAKIVDKFFLSCMAPEAHRNRIDMLVDRLSREAKRVITEGRFFTVLNIGCGPAVEVQRFIRDDPNAEKTVFRLMDFNDETIRYAQQRLEKANERNDYQPRIKFIHKSIDVLLKEISQEDEVPMGTYDMIYCAGLFDYFSNQVCRRLVRLYYTWLRVGGLLTVTNVHPNNPNRMLIEHLLEWYIIHRDQKDMESLVPSGSNFQADILADSTNVNVFLDIRKQQA